MNQFLFSHSGLQVEKMYLPVSKEGFPITDVGNDSVRI